MISTSVHAVPMRLRLFSIVFVMAGFAVVGAATAFATTANFSPASKTACYSTTVNYSLSWSGNQPFDVDFYSDDSYGSEVHYVNTSGTTGSLSGAHYNSPDVYVPDMWVYDYGCGGSCGIGHKTGRIVVNAGGYGGCPLGPAHLERVSSSKR